MQTDKSLQHPCKHPCCMHVFNPILIKNPLSKSLQLPSLIHHFQSSSLCQDLRRKDPELTHRKVQPLPVSVCLSVYLLLSQPHSDRQNQRGEDTVGKQRDKNGK